MRPAPAREIPERGSDADGVAEDERLENSLAKNGCFANHAEEYTWTVGRASPAAASASDWLAVAGNDMIVGHSPTRIRRVE